MAPRARLTVVLLLTLIAGLAASPRSSPAAGVPAQLAVAAPVRSTVQLTLVGADGLSIRRLTDRRGAVSQVAWAPDGRRIAFVYELQGSRQVWSAEIGGGVKALTALPGENFSPSWSPDGRRIAFISTRAGTKQIFVMDGDGRGARSVIQSMTFRAVSWSPDGQMLAAVGERQSGENLDLYLMRPDGRDRRQVNRAPILAGPGMMQPAWSPDGKQLAFASRVGLAEQEITIVSGDGRPRRRLSTGYAPAWSPDARRLAFVVARVGDAQIYVANADGSQARRVTRGGGIFLLPAWAPDGSVLAMVVIRGGDLAVAVIRPDGSGERRLISTTGDLTGLPLFAWQPR